MSQDFLASMCDIDVRTVQRIEKGEQNISFRILFSIALAFSIESHELLRLALEENTISNLKN